MNPIPPSVSSVSSVVNPLFARSVSSVSSVVNSEAVLVEDAVVAKQVRLVGIHHTEHRGRRGRGDVE